MKTFFGIAVFVACGSVEVANDQDASNPAESSSEKTIHVKLRYYRWYVDPGEQRIEKNTGYAHLDWEIPPSPNPARIGYLEIDALPKYVWSFRHWTGTGSKYGRITARVTSHGFLRRSVSLLTEAHKLAQKWLKIVPKPCDSLEEMAQGREIAALLCRRWTGESLSILSQQFGLAHPDSSSNLIRRARSRMEKSKQYCQAIEDIEYNLDLKTENQA